MSEIRFYHLERQSLEQVLPSLVGKALEKGHRLFVKTSDEAAAEALSSSLWTGNPEGFLPHGTAKDGRAAMQPVWLGVGEENLNGADVLILTGDVTLDDVSEYALVCEMLDGRDEQAVQAARVRWKDYQAAGHAVTYWQQDPRGGWIKKA